MNPTHKNSSDPASTPYNFIPLPEKVVWAWNDHHEVPPPEGGRGDLRSGYFEVDLKALSPLYVRAARKMINGAVSDEEESAFFNHGSQENPVIPGSSLRGMLRSLVEIASFSRTARVTDKPLFHRGGDKGLSGVFADVMGNLAKDVRGGFIRPSGDAWEIVPTEVLKPASQTKAPSESLPWQGPLHQHSRVWFSKDGRKARNVSAQKRPGYEEGLAYYVGPLVGQRRASMEFVFALPEQYSSVLPVGREVVERFTSDGQLTPSKWQRENYRDGQGGKRDKDGHLLSNPPHPGEPIFYVLGRGGRVSHIGRAKAFRIPHDRTPRELVPINLREVRHSEGAGKVDYADALFGYVWTERDDGISGTLARKGRVSVSSAKAVPESVVMRASAIRPRFLSSPNPTAYQHYLTQPDQNSLRHYSSRETTTIRGHKLYWRQGAVSADDLEKAGNESNELRPTLRPVLPPSQFRFSVHFSNLRDDELGVLAWCLGLSEAEEGAEPQLAHSLGMGKPLGMGAVQLNTRLFINDPRSRYASLHSNGRAETAAAAFKDAFVKRMDKELGGAGRFMTNQRIGFLRTIMSWPGFPCSYSSGMTVDGRPNTRYMELDEYDRKKPLVLPDPTAFDSALGRLAPVQTAAGKPGNLMGVTGIIVRLTSRGGTINSSKFGEVIFQASAVETEEWPGGKEMPADFDYAEEGMEVKFTLQRSADGQQTARSICLKG